PADGRARRRARVRAAGGRRRSAAARGRADRADRPWLGRGAARMSPQVLPPNVLSHFYAGGPRIAALRGIELESDHMPEEWIGAVNTMFGQAERGLSRFADGTLGRDAVAAEPEAYLGAEHVARYGSDAALLVKLLDAGQ